MRKGFCLLILVVGIVSTVWLFVELYFLFHPNQ
jgi:hypothetical protein